MPLSFPASSLGLGPPYDAKFPWDVGSCDDLSVSVCVCVLICLNVNAQSGPVLVVILHSSRWSSDWGVNDTCYENLSLDATEWT